MRQVIAGARAAIEASAFPRLELHVTEWGSTVNPFDAVHDTSNQAAFICKAITTMNGLVDSFSYWTVSDIFEELGLPDRAFHGGFGLTTMQGVHKPAYTAFSLLNQLGRELCEVRVAAPGLPSGAEVVAARTGKELQLLAWYYVNQGTAPAPEPVTISLQITKGIFPGSSDLDFSVTEVGTHRANAYEAWKNMGAPRNPTPAQIEDLKQDAEIGDDEAMFGEARQDEEQLTIKLTLDPESVKLIKIFRA
jgi:xylan 1,4-beta-xylosidase